jgi:hypothetical protein
MKTETTALLTHLIIMLWEAIPTPSAKLRHSLLS